MMKKKLLLLFALALVATATALADVEINEANFPDPVFREYVAQFDTDQSGSFCDEELAAVTDLAPVDLGIVNLKGVEHFKSCTSLNITGNQIKDVDVSALDNLVLILCYGIGMESISFHPNLHRLLAYGNNLTELIIPENSQMEQMQLDNNPLTKLVLPNMPCLTFLQIKNTLLEELDVTHAPMLTTLDCCIGKLQTIDLSNNTELVTFYANGNELNSLDLSHNSNIRYLYLNSNKLTELDISPLTELQWFRVAYNPLNNLIMGDHRKMEIMVVAHTELEELDVSSCIGMTHLIASDSKFKHLDLSNNFSLNELDCSSNELTELDVSASQYLCLLFCHNNQLEHLKFQPGMSPFNLIWYNNQLKGEGMDEAFESMWFMTSGWGLLYSWAYNSSSPLEGNEFSYTLVSALKQGLDQGYGNLIYSYSGDESIVNIDNYWDYVSKDQQYDGCPSLTLDEYGLGTFTCVIPFDLDNTYGPKVYRVDTANGNQVHLVEASGSVEAGTGIVLVGEPNEEVYIPSAYWESWGPFVGQWSCSPLENNLLVGNLKSRSFAAGEAYILKDGKFVLTQGDRETLPCHTAYLPAEAVTNGANTLYLVGDGLTGVEDINAPVNDENAPIFDVMGRRVINPQAGGIYIQNGRKFIAK